MPNKSAMNRTSLASILSVVVSLLLSACGGDQPPVEEAFRLAETPAEELRMVGMAKEMGGDTVGMNGPSVSVPSPDGSKLAYAQGKNVYVADADSKTSKLLYDGAGEENVQACYNIKWAAAGDELSFTQAKQIPGDSVRLMTVIITLGRSSEGE